MPIGKITKKSVESLIGTKKNPRTILWDETLKGFGVRLGFSGTKTYLVQYRREGREGPLTRFMIGKHGKWTAERARKRAKVILGQVAEGKDPHAAKIESRSRSRSGQTVAAVLELFDVRWLSKLRTGKEIRRALDQDMVPKIGKKLVADVRRRDLIEILDKIEERGAPFRANRMIAFMGRFFSWSLSKDLIEANPAVGLAKRGNEKDIARTRVLTDDEIVAVWQAAGVMGNPFGDVIKLLLLTGQRLSEVAEMEWSEVDAKAKQWMLPGARTKNKHEHIVPLSAAALTIIKNSPRHGTDENPCPYVFTTNGQTPAANFSKAKRILESEMLKNEVTLPDWRFHDLRRTMTTVMASKLDVPPHVVEKILNHISGTISGVARIYNRAEYLPERRQALDAWAAYVARLVTRAKRANSKQQIAKRAA